MTHLYKIHTLCIMQMLIIQTFIVLGFQLFFPFVCDHFFFVLLLLLHLVSPVFSAFIMIAPSPSDHDFSPFFFLIITLQTKNLRFFSFSFQPQLKSCLFFLSLLRFVFFFLHRWCIHSCLFVFCPAKYFYSKYLFVLFLLCWEIVPEKTFFVIYKLLFF